jgi:hypothetical protein
MDLIRYTVKSDRALEASVLAFTAILCIVATTIAQLRDPLSLTPRYRRATESWAYVAMLFWSCVVGLTLPVVGLYLWSRGRESPTAGK